MDLLPQVLIPLLIIGGFVYLFIRRNPRGMHHERWCHTYGCGQWFNLWRHTVTHLAERVAAMDRAGASLQLPP